MQRLDFIEKLMVIHHFTKSLFKYSSIKDIDPNLNETHAKILLFVHKHKQNKMSKINGYIGLQKGAFTTSVDILIHNGYMLKRKDEKDKRSTNLELTAKGIEVAEKLKENLYQSINEMFDHIDEDEKEAINYAVEVLSQFCMKHRSKH